MAHIKRACYFFEHATDYYKIPRKLKKLCKQMMIAGTDFKSNECRIRCYTKNFRHTRISKVTAYSLGL